MEIKNGQRFDFLDRLAKTNLTSYESRVSSAILKCHLIYNNGGVLISLSRICKATGLTTNHTCRAIRGLIHKQILFKNEKNGLPFYSFSQPIRVLPIKVIEQPIRGEGGLPDEVIEQPIRGEVISNSKELNNNISGKENQNIEKDFKTETEKRFKIFFEQYPGAWHKGIEKQALGLFLDSTPHEQDKFLKAVKNYKNTKAVKDKKILSPLNFLKSTKIINQYSEEAEPKKSFGTFDREKFEQLKKEAEANPPKGSLLEDFDKLVGTTAASKKGRG